MGLRTDGMTHCSTTEWWSDTHQRGQHKPTSQTTAERRRPEVAYDYSIPCCEHFARAGKWICEELVATAIQLARSPAKSGKVSRTAPEVSVTGGTYIDAPGELRLVDRKGGARLDFLYSDYIGCKNVRNVEATRNAENDLFREIVLYAESVLGKEANKKAWVFANNLSQKVTDASAADPGQESALKVWRGLNSFRGQCKFSTWVYETIKNVITDVIRDRARHPVVEYWDWKGYDNPAPMYHNGTASGSGPDSGSSGDASPSWAHHFTIEGDTRGDPKSNSDSYGENSGGKGHTAGPMLSKQACEVVENEYIESIDDERGERETPIQAYLRRLVPGATLLERILERLSPDEALIVQGRAAGQSIAEIARLFDKDQKWIYNKLFRIKSIGIEVRKASKAPPSVV